MADISKILYDLTGGSLGSSLSESCGSNCKPKKKLKEDMDDADDMYDNDSDDDDFDEEGLFEEDAEADALVQEALIQENCSPSEITYLIESGEVDRLRKLGLLSEKSIVRLDKQARLSRAESQAVLIIAKEKNDRDFKKLQTIWKMRKFILAKLEKKYGNQAKKMAKDIIKKSKTSNTIMSKKLSGK